MSGVAGSDPVGILAAVLLFVVAALLGMVVWIFLDFRKTITHEVKTNGRHLDSINTSMWVLVFRVDAVENFLDETTEFRPIKMPSSPKPPS